MTPRPFSRGDIGRRCSGRFYRPAEHDGPGTLTIFEFQCVLRDGHRGPHQVDRVE